MMDFPYSYDFESLGWKGKDWAIFGVYALLGSCCVGLIFVLYMFNHFRKGSKKDTRAGGGDLNEAESLYLMNGNDTVFNTGVKKSAKMPKNMTKSKDKVQGPRNGQRKASAPPETGVISGKKSSTTSTTDVKYFESWSTSRIAKYISQIWPRSKWESRIPSRPDKPLCLFFLRTGGCSTRHCRKDHPPRGKGPDEGLFDAVTDTGDSSLIDMYELAFGFTQAVENYKKNLELDIDSRATERVRVESASMQKSCYMLKEAFERLGVLATARLDHLWCSESAARSYGLEITFYHVILPRVVGALQYLCDDGWPDCSSPIIPAIKDIHSDIHARIMGREDLVAGEVMNRAPLVLPIRPEKTGAVTNGDKREQLSRNTALKLYHSLVSHCSTSVDAMASMAALRDSVLDDLDKLLLPHFKHVISERFQDSSIPDIQDALAVDVDFNIFGSSANTIGTPSSDLDIAMKVAISVKESHAHSAEARVAVRGFLWSAKEMLSHALVGLGLEEEGELDKPGEPSFQPFTLREFVGNARVPVAKLRHTKSGIDIDLIECGSNDKALLNTQLLREYASADPRVRPLMYAVKRWANARCVSDSRKGTLSTYCWIILVVFYLQNQSHSTELFREEIEEEAPPKLNLQNLQGEAARTGEEKYVLRDSGELNDTTLVGIYSKIPKLDMEPVYHQADLVRLLLNFFAFYATESPASFQCFYDIVSIRKARAFPKMSSLEQFEATQFSPLVKGQKLDKVLNSRVTWRISVEDPFELDHDLGTVVRSPVGQAHILAELRRAMVILYRHLVPSDLMWVDDGTTDPFKEEEIDNPDVFAALCEPLDRALEAHGHCFICSSVEHTFEECPRFVCFKCNQLGHFTRDCPNGRLPKTPKPKAPKTMKAKASKNKH